MALRPLNLRLMRPCQFQPAWRLCNVLPAVARSGAGLRVPARLTLYSVLGHWSEGYSYLVGRSGEQTLLDKLRDTYGKALEFAVAGVPQDLEPRTVLLNGATVDVLAALGRTISTCSSVAHEAMAQSAGSCSVVFRRG